MTSADARAAAPPEQSVTEGSYALNQRLLDSIVSADWKTYEKLCDPSISAFEPEARGRLIEGMPFHISISSLVSRRRCRRPTMCSPHVRMLGEDAAVVSYVRLVQKLDESGSPVTTVCEETRGLAAASWRLAARPFSPLEQSVGSAPIDGFARTSSTAATPARQDRRTQDVRVVAERNYAACACHIGPELEHVTGR